ncbi:glucan biosynthesis protein [Luteimonas salinilitoris]|uniref:Glucan biosynthesis protein n=1 Tax=Luteimonas salinilitoris TaxID=3237697 RepID=A0ABV4HU83_9GAMM
MKRRQLLSAALLGPLAFGPAARAFAQPAAGPGAATAFDDGTVPALARRLAAAPYRKPAADLPAALDAIGYDQYRDFRYKAARALWREQGLPFQAQFFHRGFLFKDRVAIHVVQGRRSRPFAFSTDLFDYAPQPVPELGDIGFAGFRLHAPLNDPGRFDELCAFLGASYFRALPRGLGYGLSARGLALGTGEPEPEEFPVFRAFWLEQPDTDADHIVVHALLDSPSVAGAFRFRIVPGAETVFDVDARLFPRRTLALAGIAPLTSMFHFDAGDRVGIDDWRPAVHDSDGLALLTGAGEQVWRPLANPATLQHSGFQERDPRGFGLMQRKRAAADFLDAEAAYENRPSLWVEPLDDWGEGEAHLVEIPTADEYHDNIVAFWRPRAPLAAGRESRWRYRLHWCDRHEWKPALATVAATRAGAAADGARLFVIDWRGESLARLADDAEPPLQASASAGELRNAVAYRNPRTGGWRSSFELVPGDAAAIELRLVLGEPSRPLSETWLYRWTA